MRIVAIYASTSGNVEAVVEHVAQQLRTAGHDVVLNRAEKTNSDVFDTSDVYLLATSTWEHGELNPFFRKLYTAMTTLSFAGKRALVIGLGDTRYEPVLFGKGADMLAERWQAQGGQLLTPVFKIDGEPFHQLHLVDAWLQAVLPRLNEGAQTS